MKSNHRIIAAYVKTPDFEFVKEWAAKESISTSELIYKALMEYFKYHAKRD